LKISAQGVPKTQLKECQLQTKTNGEQKQEKNQKRKLPCYIIIPKQGKGFNHHEW